MANPRILIAGTHSGAGKTTLTLGLMAAFIKRGLRVQGFKCGPDYIDPAYHTAITQRPSRNLDSWMMNHDLVRNVYLHGSRGADLSIMEGVMGLYDGKSPTSDVGSSAEISLITKTPVILVINIKSMARSAAAIVKGFQSLNPKVNIVGVIANFAGSKGHGELVRQAIEQECGIPLLGVLTADQQISIPERHLGLLPAVERGELEGLFTRLADVMEENIDLEGILALAGQVEDLGELGEKEDPFVPSSASPLVRIAVARDGAFNFYYPENLELLQAAGAELVYFSPVAGEQVPSDVDGLYIGGGFPEEFAPQLCKHDEVAQSVKGAIEKGMPTLAECGGFMYLTDELEKTDGTRYPMAGVIPGRTVMQKKLVALGYREVTGLRDNFLLEGQKARGHEFHYSTFEPGSDSLQPAYMSKGLRKDGEEGVVVGPDNLVAGYTHLHFASQPHLVSRWIDACQKYQMKKSAAKGI
ncbi:MAG TPA: cobyrinic acid a,c-diamide synthase [Paenibacillaceae bacterium]|nr:cobyrinic acid a,c-diamide synthase [Paenibacillaceae bacterium]